MEVVSESPYISVVHDFLSEKEINFMVEYSIPRYLDFHYYVNTSRLLSKFHQKDYPGLVNMERTTLTLLPSTKQSPAIKSGLFIKLYSVGKRDNNF